MPARPDWIDRGYVDEDLEATGGTSVCYSCCAGQNQGGVRTVSMDLDNDPRFFSDTVIDKRITAFAALSIVSGIMSGASVDQCFDSNKEFRLFDDSNWYNISIFGCMQLAAYAIMCLVLALNVFSTLVFGAQFYFTIRLLTAGPTGVESAKAFYLDPIMVRWRHISAQGLIKGMPLFLLAVGCMLCVKIKKENADTYHTVGWLTCLFFASAGLWLYFIGHEHQLLFENKYYHGHEVVKPYLRVVASRTSRTWW